MKDQLRRFGALSGALGTMLAVGFVLAGPASATADPVDTAFTDMQSKITTYGGAMIALVVLAVGIFLGIKYLKRGVKSA